MKTDNHNLESLLAEVEHAGRDARRRDELATMIDRMAASESTATKHGFWWWSARVAAAACIIFFISTAVRIWFIPTEPSGPMVAETEVASDQWPVASVDSTIVAPTKPIVQRHIAHNIKPITTVHFTVDGGTILNEETTDVVEEEVLPAVEELVVEEVNTSHEIVEEDSENTIDAIATPVVSVAYNEPEEQSKDQTRRRNILSGLFRQPEPDDMTGTVLAFRIL